MDTFVTPGMLYTANRNLHEHLHGFRTGSDRSNHGLPVGASFQSTETYFLLKIFSTRIYIPGKNIYRPIEYIWLLITEYFIIQESMPRYCSTEVSSRM